MNPPTSLMPRLQEWDGKATGPLERLRDARTEAAVDEAIALLTSDLPHVAAGASWLIKAWLEAGCTFGPARVQRVVGALASVADRWARLHLCQTIRFLHIREEEVSSVMVFLEESRAADRPFERAWAADAMHHLALTHPSLTNRAQASLEAALTDPAASVRARARRLLEGK